MAELALLQLGGGRYTEALHAGKLSSCNPLKMRCFLRIAAKTKLADVRVDRPSHRRNPAVELPLCAGDELSRVARSSNSMG